MKNISILLFATFLASSPLTKAMQPATMEAKTDQEITLDTTESAIEKAKKSAQDKVYLLKDQCLSITDQELKEITDLENVQVKSGDKIKYLKDLQKLSLNNNQISGIPTDIGKLTKLKWLELHNNLISEIPTDIGKLTNLSWLGLHNNLISVIPTDIGKLTNLSWLELGDNQISVIPTDIGKLTNLYWLVLYNNQISVIPACIGNLTNLDGLWLYNNQISVIPTDIGKLTKLKWLGLHNNRISVIPTDIGKLTNLDGLRLHNNRISVIPTCISNLNNITVLFLSNNRLTSLPPALAKLTNIKMLNLMDNPFGMRLSVAASQAFIVYNLAGQPILGTIQKLLPARGEINIEEVNSSEDKPFCLFHESEKLTTLEDLARASDRNIDTALGIIVHNLPTIEKRIEELEGSEESIETHKILVTLRDHVKLYQWLLGLIEAKKIYLGNPTDILVWAIDDKEASIKIKNVRNMIMNLVYQKLCIEA